MTTSPSETLQRFRAEIDALDDKLFALLIERAGIIEKVAEYKRGHEAGTANLRPGREADMVRRVYNIFKTQKFSPDAAAAMWRLIISGSLKIETNFSVSVYATETDQTCYWLAREYFGAFTPITRQPTTNRVIGDIMEGKVKVGVLPLPQGEGIGQWWHTLLEKKNEEWPKIFAYIPFIHDEKNPKDRYAALAIGKVIPEATGDDISYITLTTQGDVSTHRLQTAFTKAGLNATWVNVHTVGRDLRHHLVQVREFLYEDHPKLKSLISEMGESAINILLLGAYAAPIAPASNKLTTEQGKPNDKPQTLTAASHAANS